MFEEQGASPESPTGTEVLQQTDPSSAGTQNTEPQGQVVTDNRGNVIPPWRVNEMIQRATDHTAAQLRQEFAVERQQMMQEFARQSQTGQQALIQGLQQKASGPAYTPEQARERQQAREMLHDLEPAIKAVPALAQEWNRLTKEMQEIRRDNADLRTQHETIFARSEEGRLQQLATQAGIPVQTPQQFQALNNYVAGIIRSDPQALADFKSGDLRVVPWALGIAKQEIDAQRQAARASLATTKSNLTRTVPPRIGGSQPGATPIPKYDPKDPRGSMAKIHAGAAAAWEQMTG